jgi:hypothetical protein
MGFPIAVGIRPYKALFLLLIVFLTSFLTVVLPAQGRSSRAICPNLQTSIRIIDESDNYYSETYDPGKSYAPGSKIANLRDPFKTYVKSVSQYVFTKVNRMTGCLQDAYSPHKVELFFVYRPMSASAAALKKKPFDLERLETHNIRSLESPWAKLTIRRSPNLLIRGMFIWNERQFVVDQATMSGTRIPFTQTLRPMNSDTFLKYVSDYVDSYIYIEYKLPKPRPETIQEDRARLHREEAIALKNLEKRLPAEVFWLLSNSGRGLSPFLGNVRDFLLLLSLKVTPRYIALNQSLIDEFLVVLKM